MWMIDYGATWIKFYKVDKKKSFQFVSPPTSRLFFYLLEKVLAKEGCKKNELLILGFPGVVKNGKVITSPNLDRRSWKNVNLQQRLNRYKLNSYVINDADLHGHLVIKGKGVEVVLSLGTGVGSSIYMDGRLVPNTELGHHLLTKGKTYEEHLGYKAFLRSGRSQWIKNLKTAIETVERTFNPDRIYLTGGLSNQISHLRWPRNVRFAGNPVPSKKNLKALADLL